MEYILAILLTLSYLGCSKKSGDHGDSIDSEDPSTKDSGLNTVSGVITVGGSPRSGVFVAAVDLTDGKRKQSVTSDSGTWTFKSSDFIQDHEYSFHLFDENQVALAVVDFSSSSGLQGGTPLQWWLWYGCGQN